MKFIRKEESLLGKDRIKTGAYTYFYDDIGGEKGVLSILRNYEKAGYRIEEIQFHKIQTAYDGPTCFKSFDEYYKHAFLFPSVSQCVSIDFEKDILKYTIFIDHLENSIWIALPNINTELYDPNKLPKLPPYHDLRTDQEKNKVKFIRKEAEESRIGMIEKYYYNDIGGEKGALNILRAYENSGYEIERISIPYESDHADPYMGPRFFSSINEYEYGSPFEDHIVAFLTKGVFSYVLSLHWDTNAIWLTSATIDAQKFDRHRFLPLPPYHELHKNG